MTRRQENNHSMAEHLRMRGRHLQTPIRCHVHPGTGRRVWLVGMVHHGEPRYYAEIKQAVAALMAAGAIVHAEGTPPPEDLSLLTPPERDVLDEQAKVDALSAEVYAAWGWVPQRTGFGCLIPQGWQRVDLTMLELIGVVGPDVMLASLQATNALLDVPPADRAKTVKRIGMRRAETYRGMALGMTPPAKPTDAVFIHHRNQLALDRLDATDRDVVAVWGTSHLPGLTEGLHARGYVPDIETWHTVGHLPSRLSYLGTLVGDLARNARRLPGMWREASQQAREHTTKEARR